MKRIGSLISLIISLIVTFSLLIQPVAADWSRFDLTLTLDGVDDYASAPDSDSLDLGTGSDDDFTISLWLYVPDLTNTTTDTLVWKQGAYGLYIMHSVTSQDRFIFQIYTGPISYVYTYGDKDLTVGWHYISATFDNEYTIDQDQLSISVDGTPVATSSGIDLTPGIPNSTSSFYIGGYSTMNPAAGWIEDVKITGNSSEDVRAWWHFDEDWGDAFFLDSSTFGNTLTGSNGAQIGNPTGFPPLPGTFSKTSPSSGLYPKRPTTLTITWTASLAAFDGYEYCYDTTNNYVCDTSWLATTDTQATLTELTTSTYYFWQVRARNTAGSTEADSGSWWGFETVPLPPLAFSKYIPADGAVNQALDNLYVIWHNSSGADSYEYCYDTIDDDACPGGWTNIGFTTMVLLDNLSYGATYYYQVRAVNWGGTTYADGGTWWSFTTLPEAPAAFAKTSPPTGAIDQPGIVTLAWDPSTRATSYEYCWNESYTENTTDCIHGWVSAGANTTADFNVGIREFPRTYYWQVRAVNAGGVAFANSGNWWSFTTVPPPPVDLFKWHPADGSTYQPNSITLDWFVGRLVDEYQYCYDTTPGTTCEGTWTSTGTNTSAEISDLLPATTYYWQMRALNSGGTSYAGNWWSFTTTAIPGPFDKNFPLQGATGVGKNVDFYWYDDSTNALTYEYCYDTSINSNCDTSWTTANTIPINVTSLEPSTTYNWQVRTGNSMGYTYANGGTWWLFTTGTTPAAFSKTAPPDGVANQPFDIVISWAESTGKSYYEYCYDTSDDSNCSAWLSTPGLGKRLDGLSPYTTYYWQVRAVNSFGTVYADGSSSDFWDFTMGGVPGAFERTSPPNEADGLSINPTLTWNSSSNVGTYSFCIDTSDDNDCSDWSNNFGNTSVQVSGLEPGTTYYWHANAGNDFGITYAGGSDTAFWSFTTDPNPAAFNKAGPADGATNQLLNLDLTWEPSLGASYYEYCYGTTNPCTNWAENSSATSQLLEGLSANTTYYWNVRAVNDHSTTYSNGNETSFWSFTTGALPVAFTKLGPHDGGVNYSSEIVILVWYPSNQQDEYGFYYEYCYDTINNTDCDSTWISTHTNSSDLTDLIPSTYYWQVRANNSIGNTFANDGVWWSFTIPPVPGTFSKTSPANGALNRPVNLTLTWAASSDAFEYEYCLKKVGETCTWTSTGSNTSAALTGLASAKYQWQVRAKNANGTTTANDGTFWSFTVPALPGAFGKTSPASGAIKKPTTLTLYWGTSANAISYQYCLKKKLSDSCIWKSTGTTRNVILTGLLKGSKYYWQVRAKNSAGTTTANDGTWWNFTTVP